MDMNDIDLRRIYRSYVADKIPASREKCPSVEEIRDAFDAATPKEAKNAIVNHVTRCSDCAREFDFIREVREREEDLTREISTVCRQRRPVGLFLPRPLWGGAIVLVVAAMTISGFILLRRERAGDDGRGGSPKVPTILAPSGRLMSSPAPVFRWEPVAGAVAYIVEVYDESLRSVWESPQGSTPAVAVPISVWEGLKEGRNYYWTVLALDANGEIGEPRLETFVVIR